ncbi:MAG: hypothetical protein K8H84_10930 [Sulfuricella denitrificans]|nr:hypothetical protein [Sulfuricella denitrificans]
MGLLDLLLVLAKYRKMIVSVTLGVTLLATVIVFLLPKTYTGNATILPPQQSQTAAISQLSGQLGMLAGLAGASLGGKKNSELYIGMLKSRSVADKLIERFKLGQVYGEKLISETRRCLDDATRVTSGKDGIISIEVDDRDPARAAALANAYVEELQALTQSLAVTEASHRRLFFENQLKQVRDELGKAELALKKTQETTGLMQPQAQAETLISGIAKLRAQLTAKEVEISAIQTFATGRNPDLLIARNELASLKAQLAKAEKADTADGGVMVPTGNFPSAGLEYLRRLREVKYQEVVFELMAKQFESAKIDEAKDHAQIQQLDKAEIPERKSAPRRLLIIVLSALLAAMLSVLVALLREALERSGQNPYQAERLRQLRKQVTG